MTKLKQRRKTVVANLVEVELNALRAFCLENKTSLTTEIIKLIDNKNYAELISLKCDPKSYTEAETEKFRIDYQASSMLKKSKVIPLPHVDRKANAMRKFYDAEELCAITNQVLINWSHNPNDNPWLIDIVARAQQIIQEILGDLDAEALMFVEQQSRFGPGSTRTCRRHATDGRKFDNPRPGATPRCAEFLKPNLPTLWADCITEIRLIAASGITCVPKNATTDRTIGIEPDLNIYMQLGTGKLIRERLKSFGVDLDTQADRNASLARRAWVLGLSTIDLSSASDCVSRSLVHLLLPERWRHLLWLSRTDFYEVDGKQFPFNKWSSMGNGYTFELESLIFLALARACGDKRAVAYGDDIIVSKGVAPLLIRTLNFVGFRVNTEKTFLDGLFFESCGTDWFCGENVRPFFFKGSLDGLNTEDEDYPLYVDAIVYQYANAVSATASSVGHGYYRDSRYFSIWRSLYQVVPKSNRYRIPAGFNPRGGFEGDWDEASSSSASASAFTYLGFTPRTVWTDGDRGPYLSSLHRLGRMRDRDQLPRLSIREDAIRLAAESLSSRSYHRDGEAVRYEGSLSTTLGSCFAWPNRGPWR